MVEIIPGYGRMDEVLALVKEYTDMIAGQGGDVVECLKSQHLDAELLDMEKKYGLPPGTIRNKDGRDTRSDKTIGAVRREAEKKGKKR